MSNSNAGARIDLPGRGRKDAVMNRHRTIIEGWAKRWCDDHSDVASDFRVASDDGRYLVYLFSRTDTTNAELTEQVFRSESSLREACGGVGEGSVFVVPVAAYRAEAVRQRLA